MIQTNRRVTIDEVAFYLKIGYGIASEIIHNRLGFRIVCARWFLKQLTGELKRSRVVIC